MFSLLLLICNVFFFKQKTAYEMRISDWSSDVCSSDLRRDDGRRAARARQACGRRAACRRQAQGRERCPRRRASCGRRAMTADLALIWPELILTIGGLITLMIGAFAGDRRVGLFQAVALLVLAGAAVAVVVSEERRVGKGVVGTG